MKKRFTLLLLIAGIMSLKAQVVLHESFTAPFNPTANGWDVQNLSSATGTNTTGWFQGTSTVFDAIVGGPNDYYAADMNSAAMAGATNTISCWLITPTLNLVNGAWFQFVTKGSKLPVNKPDRMQVYYSLGAGTNVGTTAGSATNTAGTFTNLVMEVNANLSPNYPSNWFVLSASLTSIATPTVGRLAFRYYVPNGGPGGPNGNYIGIDEFRFAQPCTRPQFFGDPSPGVVTCVGVPAEFRIYQATPLTPATSYTWHTGATTSITTIVPTTTGVVAHWTLGETTPGCQALDVSFYFSQATPTIQVTQNPNTALCAGSTVTVSTTGANTYTYIMGPTSSSTQNPIVLTAPNVSMTVLSQYTVAGKATNGCVATQTMGIHINPRPTVSVSVSKNVVCAKTTVTLSASGASTYSWSGSSSSTMNVITYSAGTAGVNQFTLHGVSTAGCKSADVVTTVTVSGCTGIEEGVTESLSIYPNPFSEVLHLVSDNDYVLAELYTISGTRVATLENTTVLNTSSLSSGIYFLRVVDRQNQEQRFKLIKQ